MDFIDFVGTGECEVTIAHMLEHLEDETNPLYNVIYRDNKGRVRESKRKKNVSIETLPFPKYHVDDFSVEPADLILPIELGRGCPWGKCTFCPDESYGVLCQSKTASQIKGEMDYHQSISRDLRNFIILDPDALKDRQLVLELSEYLHEKNFFFHFAEFRAERMDRDVLQSLLRFGEWISHFQVGIESFSDQILRLMDKGVSALRNVEVLKMVAELGVPLQFNLFTCYPNMTAADLDETLRVMDLITHILLYENILIYPGEFYLPTDCPVFLEIDRYDIERSEESIFADVFEDFPMPSYSNYPYPYEFDNQEEQVEMAAKIRDKVEEIKSKSPDENFMCYNMNQEELQISFCRDGILSNHVLTGTEKAVYVSALETSQKISDVSKMLKNPQSRVEAVVEDFSRKGLILRSSDRGSFLSLATPCK